MSPTKLEDFLVENKPLVNELINLIFVQSKLLTEKFHWFYELVSIEDIELGIAGFESEDFKQDMLVHLIEVYFKYNLSTNLTQYMRKNLVWFAVNKIKTEANRARLLKSYQTISINIIPNIKYLLTNNNLNPYEQYILYLRFYKCYDVQDIAKILYSSRESIRFTLNNIIERLHNV